MLSPLGHHCSLKKQACSPLPSWLAEFCFHHILALQPCCVCQHHQKPPDTPAGHEVLWKVPMQLIFLTPSPTDQTSPTPSPFEQKCYFGKSFLQDRVAAEPFLHLKPCPDPKSGKFPFLSPHSQGSAYAVCTSPSSLALPWQCCRQPRASQDPEPMQTSNTPSFHHCPRSLIAASSG